MYKIAIKDGKIVISKEVKNFEKGITQVCMVYYRGFAKPLKFTIED